MKLEESIKQSLLHDYYEVNQNLAKVFSEGINLFVVEFDYLTPTVAFGENVPYDHNQGEFQYYSRIRQALESALTTGRVPENQVPDHWPDYLKNILKG